MVIEEDFNNKNQLNKILKKVDKIQGKVIIDQQNKTINGKFNATITGGYMPNDGFSPKQLEQLGLLIKPINDRLDVIEKDISGIKDRLDVIEEDMKNVKEDMKAIKECPTIKKELKNK